MLQAMRSKAAGIVVKVLFSILVLSFAVWGVGDYSFLQRSDPTVVSIGDVSISQSRLDAEYRKELDRLRRSLPTIDVEMARQFGLPEQVVDRLVNQTLFDKATDRLGVRIGAETVRDRIVNAPELQGPTGFDRMRFQQMLYDSGMNEAGFIDMFRRDMARGLVMDALGGGARPTDPLVDRIYRYRNEKRGGNVVFVANSSITDIGKPTDAEIQSVYDDNKDAFTAPEYRELTVVRVSADELLDKVTVEPSQVEDEYRARLADLRKPERREVEQLLFADEAAAKAAFDGLKSGRPFADVAKDAGQAPDQTNLGLVTTSDLPPALATPVFQLSLNGVAEPVKSPFGWHVATVTKIEPGSEPTFAELKDQLAIDLKQRAAAEDAYEHATTVEDALADGATLEAGAAKAGVPAVKVAAIDSRGRTPDGAPVALLDGAIDAIAAAFDTAGGRTSQLVEGKQDAWYLIRVDGVTPSALKPLNDVRGQVVERWEAQKRADGARFRAQNILDQINGGKQMAAAAEPLGLKVDVVAPSVRTITALNVNMTAPPEVVSRFFTLKQGESALVASQGGVYVARLLEIQPADPAADGPGVEQLRAQLRQQFANDMITEYGEALKQRFTVTIDRSAIDKL